ncbi:hypothetical protein BS47DRAFT_1374347 [Hydnum rufescens UP504]|uniref:AdoMet-dependent rRNA methyltransferase SPB1 n=1 Tax=Hydnum rufescens UP504 TaxID=1448309 RepID=A0A9P6AFT1_9AGAM|nr:hypothetical protein BS47DRAFT_1374347 [Hydnum rufescens UP504]
MAKTQKKTGKGRIDKYYKLAKEQGYRARSAFKLIQLNKKFQFLESARCCIDLCAAPGGWLQVASKYMPANSLIVGVDLVPIRPIPRVATFAADITTAQCRTALRSHLKDWKADVVLHDGAPNVGTAWVQDAFTQSELVLSSLKLAVEFLIKGGTFVTKVFRSQDYNNLIWVFTQLFGKVEATKPPSSRNVSAEIFVVCTNFLAPARIDPKFLDPKHVFKEVTDLPPVPVIGASSSTVTTLTPAATNVFQPGKKRRHRDGYADGDYTLFKSAPASEFVRTHDPITFLGTYNKIDFHTEEEKEWLNGPLMTVDLRANFEDLKVLGKGDFKALLKWRLAIREELGIDRKSKPTEELTETVEVTEPVDEEGEIQEELERLNTEASAREKRERRRRNEKKTKTIQRMQLSMTTPMDIGQEFADSQLNGGDIFDLGEAEKRGMRNAMEGEVDSDSDDDKPQAPALDADDEVLDSEDERERKLRQLEGTLDGMYENYRERMSERDAKWKARQARLQDKKNDAWAGIRKPDDENSDDSDAGGSDAREIVRRAIPDGDGSEGGWDVVQKAKARAGEDDSSSDADSSDEDRGDDEPFDEEELPSVKRRKTADGSAALVTPLEDPKNKVQPSKAAQVWFSQDVFKGVDDLDHIEDDEDGSSGSETGSEEQDEEKGSLPGDEDDFDIVPQTPDDTTMWDVDDVDEDHQKARTVRKTGLTTAEAITLAQQLVNRQTTKTHLINDGFNRYSLNSKEDLPDWFLDDEQKHYKSNIPITKEAINMLRAKQRALDARPIKKVAEAKARKKMRAVQRFEKAVKKAEGVNQNADMSERDKAGAIEKLIRKGMSSEKKKKSEVKIVVAKGAAKGVKGRPKGVKGRYQMVDARGKKELRAKKRSEKANKKRKRA